MKYAVSPELYDQSIPQISTAKSVVLRILHETPLNEGEIIIDACCGTGKLAEFLGEYLPSGRIFGLDNAENMIEFAEKNHARENISFKLEDLTVFNPSFDKSADLITCSWAVSHIPSARQKDFTKNLYRYLKNDGRLIVLFPVMGSTLSAVIQQVVKSEAWREYFRSFESTRMTFTVEEYDELLRQTGFINTTVQTHVENIIFNNTEELDCFVTTAVARYLSYLQDPGLGENFIKDVSHCYQKKVGSYDQDIPYSMTLLSAVAKRPSLSLLLEADMPIHSTSESSQKITCLEDEKEIDPITDKAYLVKNQYNGTVNFRYRTKLFDYGVNVDLREWEAEQYQGLFSLNNCEAILETGCGDGTFWKYASSSIFTLPQLVLTDLSAAMLDECSLNLSSIHSRFCISYQQADMDNLSFPLCQFDAVLAHNVIYHSSNPVRAIESITKILKPTGFLGLSVLCHDVNQSIWKLAHEINDMVPDESFTAKFSDSEVLKLLPLYFNHIETRDYKNQLHFTESEPVVKMVKSSPIVQKLHLPMMFFETLKEKVDQEILEQGELISEFNATLYLCKNH